MQKNYWPYILICYGSLFSFGVLDNARGSFLPNLLSDLGLEDDVGSLLLFSVPSFFAFMGSFAAKSLLGKWTTVTGLRTGLFLTGAGFSSIAAAFDSYSLFAATAVFGLGFGLLAVLQHVGVAEAACEKDQRQLMNGLHGMYAASSLLAPLVASLFLLYALNWRLAFILLGALCLVPLFYSFFVTPLGDTQAHEAEASDGEWYLLPSLVVAFYQAAELSLSTRMVLYIRRFHTEYSSEQAPMFLLLFFVGLLLGRLFFTFVRLPSISNSQILSVSLVLTGIFYAMGLSVSPWFLPLVGLSLAPFFGVCMTFFNQLYGSKGPQVMGQSLSVGALLVVTMHYLIGLFSESYGLNYALWIGPLLCGLSFLCFLRLKAAFDQGTHSTGKS